MDNVSASRKTAWYPAKVVQLDQSGSLSLLAPEKIQRPVPTGQPLQGTGRPVSEDESALAAVHGGPGFVQPLDSKERRRFRVLEHVEPDLAAVSRKSTGVGDPHAADGSLGLAIGEGEVHLEGAVDVQRAVSELLREGLLQPRDLALL